MIGNNNGLNSVSCYVHSLTYNGYTLYAPLGECGIWLVNMNGQFVHHWETSNLPASYGKILPNGNLLYGEKTFETPLPEYGGIGGKIIELNWDGDIIWEYKDPYMHHDFERLPNGNTMTLRYVPVPSHISEKIIGGIQGAKNEGIMWTDAFREITPKGEVVWEWNGYEHLEPEDFVICPLDSRSEWTHCNTCFVLSNGDILTSFLKQNTTAIIDKLTGKIKWQWGYSELGHPHDPQMLNNGNILVFDNGTHRSDNPEGGFPLGMIAFSRVVEVDPKTDEIVWEYRGENFLSLSAPFLSGCQRLPNGNTLICEGTTGRIFEVTLAKEVVWEYISPFYNNGNKKLLGFSNAIFRSRRYGKDYPAFIGKNLDPEQYILTLRKNPRYNHKQDVNKRIQYLGY